MTLNTVGFIAALAAFLSIWGGHVGVRLIERQAVSLRVPTLAAAALGLALEVAALFARANAWSGALGIVGLTLLWDALEFHRQHHRVARGHAPANPDNPRHARLMAEHLEAGPVDWLKRDPVGRPVGPVEALALLEQRAADILREERA